MKIRIKEPYTFKRLNFQNSAKFVHLPQNLNCVLKNLDTGVEDLNTNPFKFDTGADISVINSRYSEFVKFLEPIDFLSIQYGGSIGLKKCPVYKVGIIFKGHEFEITVVYDDACPFCLLGHYQFIEYIPYSLLDSSSKQFKLYKN